MTATLENPGDKVLSPYKFAHIVLRTNNYETMVDFYEKFLGARIVFQDATAAFLTYDDEHHRVAIAKIPGTGDKVRSSSGLEHIAFTFKSLHDFALAWLQRKNNGMLPYWTVNHGTTTSAYYRDPDGNAIETQVDNMDMEAANAYIASEAFRINPIGVDFEMEDLVRRLQAGEDEDKIKLRPDIGPRAPETVPGFL
jgi:catechol-2,3-dioxygenase